MVPGVRIEVTGIRIAGAITTDGGIGIATLEAARQHTVEQPRLMESNWRPAASVPLAAPYFTVLRRNC